MQDPTSIVNGVAVRTRGSGPPLVLVHGGMGSWTHWSRNLDALAARFTVHAIDLPGCGDSLTVPRDMPEDDYIGLVIDALTGLLGDAPFRLAGFSFGGIVSALTAARMGRRIEKLALLGPGGFGRAQALELRPIPAADAPEAVVREVLRHNLCVMMIADPAAVTEETLDIHCANMRKGRFDGRRFSLGGRMAESLERIACPVQVIWGERDALPYPDVQARVDIVRRARPDARIERVPGAGHWVMYEAAPVVNAKLLDFLP